MFKIFNMHSPKLLVGRYILNIFSKISLFADMFFFFDFMFGKYFLP